MLAGPSNSNNGMISGNNGITAVAWGSGDNGIRDNSEISDSETMDEWQ